MSLAAAAASVRAAAASTRQHATFGREVRAQIPRASLRTETHVCVYARHQPAAMEPLRELKEDAQIERLLEALEKDLPQSILLFNRISTELCWRRQGLDEDDKAGVRVTIYRAAEEGDNAEGHATAVSIQRWAGMPEINVALHTTDPSCATLRRVLAASELIPWDEDKSVLFEGVHERCERVLTDEARARGFPDPDVCRTDTMLLPKEVARKLHVGEPGPGLTLRPLELRHSKVIDDSWPYASEGSESMLRETLRLNPGLSWGVFVDEDPDADPVAFGMAAAYGGLGMLHTAPSHRRRGLADGVSRAVCRSLALTRGLDINAFVTYPNPASMATLGKLGFRRVCESVWFTYTRQEPPSR